jgi:hypothetical protein
LWKASFLKAGMAVLIKDMEFPLDVAVRKTEQGPS